MSENKLTPNFYATPNFYISEVMYLLTPEEWKVLSYIARYTWGFLKESDQISLSQFEHGKTKHNGEQMDYGTGMGETAIRRALEGLKQFGVLVEVKPFDSRTRTAAEYRLIKEHDQIDLEGLKDRAREKAGKSQLRTEAARAATKTILSDKTVPPSLVGQDTPILWDKTVPPSNYPVGQDTPILWDKTTKETEKIHDQYKEREKASSPPPLVSTLNRNGSRSPIDHGDIPPAAPSATRPAFNSYQEAIKDGEEKGLTRFLKNSPYAPAVARYIEEWEGFFGVSKETPSDLSVFTAMKQFGQKKMFVALHKQTEEAQPKADFKYILGIVRKLSPQELAERDDNGDFIQEDDSPSPSSPVTPEARVMTIVTQLEESEKEADQNLAEGVWSPAYAIPRYEKLLEKWKKAPASVVGSKEAQQRLAKKLLNLRKQIPQVS